MFHYAIRAQPFADTLPCRHYAITLTPLIYADIDIHYCLDISFDRQLDGLRRYYAFDASAYAAAIFEPPY